MHIYFAFLILKPMNTFRWS